MALTLSIVTAGALPRPPVALACCSRRRRAACARTKPASASRATAAGWRPTERRSKDLQADLDKIAAERERINARLVETAKLVQQSEGQLSLIESRLGELDVQEKHLRETLEARHGSISALLGAMLRMGRNPPPVMVASRKDVLSAFRSGTLLTPTLHELGGEAGAFRAAERPHTRHDEHPHGGGQAARRDGAAERHAHAAGGAAGEPSASRWPSVRPSWPRCARRRRRSPRASRI